MRESIREYRERQGREEIKRVSGVGRVLGRMRVGVVLGSVGECQGVREVLRGERKKRKVSGSKRLESGVRE